MLWRRRPDYTSLLFLMFMVMLLYWWSKVLERMVVPLG